MSWTDISLLIKQWNTNIKKKNADYKRLKHKMKR